MKKWKKSDAGQPPAEHTAGAAPSAIPDNEAGSPEPASLHLRRGKSSVSLAELMAKTVPAERLTPDSTPRPGQTEQARKALPMSHDWFDAGDDSAAAMAEGDDAADAGTFGETATPARSARNRRGERGQGRREGRRETTASAFAAHGDVDQQEPDPQEPGHAAGSKPAQPSRPRKERSPLEIAMGLLARREHSAGELRRKLRQREVADADIDQVLADLQQRGWQSDERYAQALVRQRVARGQGPLKVRVGLQQAGIGAGLDQEAMQEQGIDWQAQAEAALARWLRSHPRQDDPERRARATRHLLAKGFSASQISLAWRRLAEA